MPTIHTYTNQTLETDDGERLPLMYSDPYDNSIIEDTAIIEHQPGVLKLRHLIHDDTMTEFDWGDIEIRKANGEDELADGEFYVRGYDDYSSRPERLWIDPDGASHIFTIPWDVPADRGAEYLQSWLDEYSSWRIGDVYGICYVEYTYDNDLEFYVATYDEAVFGIIGQDYALSYLKVNTEL